MEFQTAVESHRHELMVHCYRMVGSFHDAEDIVQETMLRAWRAYPTYDSARASIRTWLYKIATNACLSALESRKRRPLPADVGPVFVDPEAELVTGFEVPWLQPFPVDPAASAVERSRLRLAFVAALQLLPPRQRAALILCEVLDLPAAGVAELLGTTTASVTSALQRARVRLREVGIDPEVQAEPPAEQRAVVDRFVAAFERADVDGLTALLVDDVVLEMPPMRNWYRGPEDFGAFMRRVFRTRGVAWRAVQLWANGEAGFAAYASGVLRTVQVLSVEAGSVTRMTVYQDESVFDLFGLDR
jgi:RNA polymerase sigma-70 factor, ECF subfamily